MNHTTETPAESRSRGVEVASTTPIGPLQRDGSTWHTVCASCNERTQSRPTETMARVEAKWHAEWHARIDQESSADVDWLTSTCQFGHHGDCPAEWVDAADARGPCGCSCHRQEESAGGNRRSEPEPNQENDSMNTLAATTEETASYIHVDAVGVEHAVVDHGTHQDVTFVLAEGVGTLFITRDPDDLARGWRVDPYFAPDRPLDAETGARLSAQLVSATRLAAELNAIDDAASIDTSTHSAGEGL